VWVFSTRSGLSVLTAERICLLALLPHHFQAHRNALFAHGSSQFFQALPRYSITTRGFFAALASLQ